MQKNTINYRVFSWFFLKNKLDKFKAVKNQKYIDIPLTYILMKNNTGIINKIKHFSKIFDKRTYEIFKIIINAISCLKNWKQWDLANVWWKALSQVQYFFYKSKWKASLLNKLRVERIRNKIWWCREKKAIY